MKAFYAIGLALVPEFKKAKLKKPIHFALSYDEEVGCIGAHSPGPAHGGRDPQAARHHHRRAHHDDGGACPQGRPSLRHQVHRLRGAFLDDPSRRQRHPLRRRVRPLPQHGGRRVGGQGRPGTASSCRRWATFNVGTIVGGTAGNILARECEVLWGYRELPSEPIDRLGKQAIDWLETVLLPKMKAKHPAASIGTVLRSSTPAFSPQGNDEAKALAANWSGSNTVGSVGLRYRGRHLLQDAGTCRPWSAAPATSPRPISPTSSSWPPRSTPAKASCAACSTGAAGTDLLPDRGPPARSCSSGPRASGSLRAVLLSICD